jgi:hypothetical protein
MIRWLLFSACSVIGQVAGLECDYPTVDLGTVRGGPPLSHRFVLWNRGNSEVRIVHLLPSCGCVVSQVTGRVVKPGESVEVAVRVGTISQPDGPNLWSVRLYYRFAGSDENQILELRLRARLEREVGVQPAALRLGGKPGLTHPLRIHDRRDRPMEIVSVATSSSRLQVWDEGVWDGSPGQWQRTIRIRLAGDCPTGRYDDFVQIVAKDPDYQDVRIPVTVHRTDTPRYVVSPTEIRLSAEKSDFAVLLRGELDQAIQIDEIECDDPAILVDYSLPQPTRALLRASLKPGMAAQRWSAVRVQMAAPIRQMLVIPVSVDPRGFGMSERPRDSRP